MWLMDSSIYMDTLDEGMAHIPKTGISSHNLDLAIVYRIFQLNIFRLWLQITESRKIKLQIKRMYRTICNYSLTQPVSNWYVKRGQEIWGFKCMLLVLTGQQTVFCVCGLPEPPNAWVQASCLRLTIVFCGNDTPPPLCLVPTRLSFLLPSPDWPGLSSPVCPIIMSVPLSSLGRLRVP